MKHSLVVVGLLSVLLGSLPATAQRTSLTFAPHWFPQAQFAGYYVAADQGFYKAAGLDVSIVHPTASITAMDYLFAGKADVISTFLLDALKQRAKGKPIKHVGQLSQHSALLIVTKKKSGINTLKGINHKKLGVWSYGFDDVPKAFLRQNNYQVQTVPLHNTINLFLLDGIDAMVCMHYNEYDQLINSGVNEEELNTFFLGDYGFDIPEDALICLNPTYDTKKGALKAFLTATLKGWTYAATHKDYALDIVVKEMEKAHLPNNKAHQRWMLERWLTLIESGTKNVEKGCLLEQDFHNALTILRNGDKTDYPDTTFGPEAFTTAPNP